MLEHLSVFPQRQNVAQGFFIVKVQMLVRHKNSLVPLAFYKEEVPQTPDNKSNPAKADESLEGQSPKAKGVLI